MLTIGEFRPLSDNRCLIVFERDMPHPENNLCQPFVFEKTVAGIRDLLGVLLDRGFPMREVAGVAQLLAPIMKALSETEERTEEIGMPDTESVFLGVNRLSSQHS